MESAGGQGSGLGALVPWPVGARQGGQQQGTCGLDFEGGPGDCGMVVPESHSEAQAFMLTEQPAELDIIQMLGDQRRREETEG